MSEQSERVAIQARLQREVNFTKGQTGYGPLHNLLSDASAALADSERALTEAKAKIKSLEGIAEDNRKRALRTLELDREFLQQVADSYGIRTDEVTVAFLRRAALSTKEEQ